MKYYLHRISYEWELSKPLLDNGLLSIGFSIISSRDFLDKTRQEGDSNSYFDSIFTTGYGKRLDRYTLKNFMAKMQKGDIILVPLYKTFSIYEVIEEAVPVSEIEIPANLKTLNNKSVILKDGLLSAEGRSEPYDLGFIIKVKPIAVNILRNGYADSALTSRMKVRQTNIEITDIADSVKESITAFEKNKPINLKNEIIQRNKNIVLDIIKQKANPDKLEEVIKLYCYKAGASSVSIPNKNNGKKGDIDVIAVFDTLKLVLYIQAKFHSGETDSWAVEQIRDYAENSSDDNFIEGYSSIAWVITTADKYSEKALNLANKYSITLITGIEFAEMLINIGFSGMDL